MWWLSFLLFILVSCLLLSGVVIALVQTFCDICEQHVLFNEQSHHYLTQDSWRQCSQCHVYEYSSNVSCNRHPASGVLVSLEPERAAHLQYVLSRYHEHYPVRAAGASYHKNAIGKYYLWLQDTSKRQEWQEAVWIAVEQKMDTQEQVEDFMRFVVAYEAHIAETVTLHGALRMYTLRTMRTTR